MYPPQYPYPYPYQPVPVPPPEPSTPKGVGWVVRAFMIYLVAIVLSALAGVAAVILLGNFPQTQDPFALLAAALPVIALGAAASIISLVCLIFYLVGFGYLYKGRNEFGPSHARNLRIALYLLILAFALALTSIVTTVAMSFFAVRFNLFTQTTTVDPGMYYAIQAVSIAFGIVIAASVAAHFVLSGRELAQPRHERLMYVGAAVGTATPGVVGALVLLYLPRWIATITDTGNVPSFGAEVGVPGMVAAAMNFVTILIFFLVFRGAEARLRSGELKPTLPAPQVQSWMPAPVMPYAPYAPYGPYAPPPPATPPAPGPPPATPPNP